jgi:hypothetical protein
MAAKTSPGQSKVGGGELIAPVVEEGGLFL